MTDFFPIELRAFDNGHFIEMANSFRPAFLAEKKKGQVWYAFDVSILSPTTVMFTVYGMANMSSGGIGDVIDSFPAKVSSELTRPYILQRSMQLARIRRAEELDRIESEIISKYASEILDYNKL